MRPQSSTRLAIAAALIEGEATCRDLARRAGVPELAARVALNNMVGAGQVDKVRRVRVPGCNRPVPVYGRRPDASNDGGDGGVLDLISVWAGLRALEGDV
jgi:hypothetical protein